jgi:formamidopyrimidine-DNA glycosylase
MPEGPEVTVISNGLNKILKGQYLHNLDFNYKGARYSKKNPDKLSEFEQLLPLKINSIESKGKFIYFCFDKDWYMYNTLGMSGGWYKKTKNHIVVQLDHHKNKTVKDEELGNLWFDDQRHFATFKFVKGKTELEKKLKTIGPDLLNDNINDLEFITKYKKNGHKKVDVVLNDQKIFSGIGNYLKAEILYDAEISPHSIIKYIPDNKLKDLLKSSKDRIKASYLLGGASVEHYSDLNNKAGTFQDYFKVYKKKVDQDGNKVISERVSKPNDPKSQKTYWVPAVQKEYKSALDSDDE